VPTGLMAGHASPQPAVCEWVAVRRSGYLRPMSRTMGTVALAAGAAVAGGLAVRIVRSRHRRFLHPDGRSFTGELEVWGAPHPVGSSVIDRPGRYPVTVRISKGIGTRPGRADILGFALRTAGHTDLLLSTAGTGRLTRHLPVPRRSFDSRYGSILAYRTGTGRKVYLTADPDPAATPLGRTLDAVVTAADHDGAGLLLAAVDRGVAALPFGRVAFGTRLPDAADARLAFDPVRNTRPDLHPTGVLHATRALAYRVGQRWRDATPAVPDVPAVIRTMTGD
jgi:hypothetical protein